MSNVLPLRKNGRCNLGYLRSIVRSRRTGCKSDYDSMYRLLFMHIVSRSFSLLKTNRRLIRNLNHVKSFNVLCNLKLYE